MTTEGKPMDKLTPRQNEIASEALANLVLHVGMTPEKLKELRRALVCELEAVTAETDTSPDSSHRAVCG